VGGNDASIVVLAATQLRTHVFFKEHVCSMRTRIGVRSDVQFMAATQAGFDEVAQNENAIMYGGLGYVTDEVKPLASRRTPARRRCTRASRR